MFKYDKYGKKLICTSVKTELVAAKSASERVI